MQFDDLERQLGLDSGSCRVLIVEDHTGLLRTLQHRLRESGHRVVATLGVDEVSSGTAVGVDGVQFDLREFDVVFLDHFFAGRTYTGATLMPELMKYGRPKVLAMSSDRAANQAMLAAGATLAIRKNELIALVG